MVSKTPSEVLSLSIGTVDSLLSSLRIQHGLLTREVASVSSPPGPELLALRDNLSEALTHANSLRKALQRSVL